MKKYKECSMLGTIRGEVWKWRTKLGTFEAVIYLKIESRNSYAYMISLLNGKRCSALKKINEKY